MKKLSKIIIPIIIIVIGLLIFNNQTKVNVTSDSLDGLKVTFLDQTTPNMIQRLNGIFEIKPLISRVF